MRDCEINGTKSCLVMLTLVTVKFFVCIGLHEGLNAILCPNKSLTTPLLLLSSFPPTAYYDGARITNVPQDEHTRFPALNLSVSEKQYNDCYREEAHITEEREGVDPEWTDDTHGTDNAGYDEGGCTKEIAKLPEFARMMEKIPNTFGPAFPNARNVTVSSSPRNWEIVVRLGMKKLDADMLRVEKRKKSHSRRAENTNG